MKFCAGIDGGQSSTVCVLGDENGTVLARVVGPPADLVGEARASSRQNEALDGVLSAALASAELPPTTALAAVVAGISGYDEGVAPEPALRSAHDRFRAVHDAEIAHAGAFAGGPGIVLIAGTGSVAFGVNEEGTRIRAGGWGYLFGDEGSAFWIAREAIALAMRDHDMNNWQGSLSPRVLAFFGVGSLRVLQHAAAFGEIDRARLASFSTIVLAAARENEPVAVDLRRRAADALASLAHLVHRRLGSSRRLAIAAAGGLFDDGDMLEHWKWAVRAIDRSAALVKPRAEPAMGALRLALDDAGLQAGARALP